MDCGYKGPPFRWDEERRSVLRCELGAAYFLLDGIERGDVDDISQLATETIVLTEEDLSMATDPHPPDANTVIWRYMDDWKFEDMLRKFSENSLWKDDEGTNIKYINDPGQLWFSYPWTFEDDDEGTLPDINENPEEYCDRMARARRPTDQEAVERKQRFLAAKTQTVRDCNVLMAQLCGVSCWHRNSTESSSMWDFTTSKNGIALKTTVEQLEHALGWAHNTPVRRAQPSVCAVGYVDYSSYFLEYDDFRSILAIVEEGWSYEDEIRFVAKSPSILKLPLRISRPLQPLEAIRSLTVVEKQKHRELLLSNARSEYAQLRAADTEGFRLPIKLDDLIQEVVIKPNSRTNYLTEVQSLLKQTGLENVPVTDSCS